MSIANAKTTTLHAMPLLSLFLWLCEVGAGLALKHWVDSKTFCTSPCCGCGCGSRAGSGPLTGGFEVPEVETVQHRPQPFAVAIFWSAHSKMVFATDQIKIFCTKSCCGFGSRAGSRPLTGGGEGPDMETV